jgi:hypothetical protein
MTSRGSIVNACFYRSSIVFVVRILVYYCKDVLLL